MTNKILLFAIALLGLASCTGKPREQGAETSENSIQLIRNATLKIDYDGKTFLVDPMLADKGELVSILGANASPTVRLPMHVDSVVNGVEYVLASHAHFDHYDFKAVEKVGHLPTYVQPFDSTYFADNKVNHQFVTDSVDIDGVTVIRTGGHHGYGKYADTLGEVSGFVMKAPGQPTIYILGDVVWEKEIEDNIFRYRPDYVVINAGGAINPAYEKGNMRILMYEKDVVDLIKATESTGATYIAVHLEAVDHAQTTRSILRDEARHAGISEDRLIIPDDGQIIPLKLK